jgi:hypothetical protein
MARLVTRKFNHLEDLNIFLAGGLISGADVVGGQEGVYGIPGLIGLTLKFTQPATATVTFIAGTGTDPSRLTYADLKAQIEGAVTGLSVQQLNRKLVFIESTPTNGVTIDHTGTATKLLGFDQNHDTVGKKYGPVSTTAPCLQSYSVDDHTHLVITYE